MDKSRKNILDGFFGILYFNYEYIKKGEGLPIIPRCATYKTRKWNKLLRVIENNKWICPIKYNEDMDSYYTISMAEISIPKQNLFKDKYEFMVEVLHNMAHSWKIDERIPEQLNHQSYSKEELYAEMVTYAIAHYLGGHIFKHKNDAISFGNDWGELQEEEYQTILNQARNATYEILEFLNI